MFAAQQLPSCFLAALYRVLPVAELAVWRRRVILSETPPLHHLIEGQIKLECMHLRCSPPEELVLPKEFPRVRVPFLAALLSPIAWQVGRPDLFDSYSAGVLLLQMAGR